MKRLLMVALTLGLAAAASLAFAGTTEAQAEEGPGDPIPATMQLSPEVAAPGEQVTAQSITPCYPEGLVEWHVIELSGGDLPASAGDAQADADGNWTVAFAADDDALYYPAEYRFKAVCTMGDSPAYAYSADFSVVLDGSPEPEPEPAPEPAPTAPASPVRARPSFTG